MDRFLEWLKGFRALIFINNLHLHSEGGNRGDEPRWRPMLQSPAVPAASPRALKVHLAPTRRERFLEPHGNQEQIRAGWKAVIKGLEAPQKGNG